MRRGHTALVVLCEVCHKKVHQSRVPSDQQSATQSVKEAFIAYIARESDILQHADFGTREHPDYVGYESGYPRENNFHQIWLAAWLPDSPNGIAAVIAIQSDSGYFESHYKKFEKYKSRIEDTFSFEGVKFKGARGGIWHLRVVKQNVDLTQTANWDVAFRWLRENLEKLYWVLRGHDNLGWDTSPIRKRRIELCLTQI